MICSSSCIRRSRGAQVCLREGRINLGGHKLAFVHPHPAVSVEQHELTFTNDTVVVCDIVVGADGANSRVRPLVSAATPLYTGSLVPSSHSLLMQSQPEGTWPTCVLQLALEVL